MSTLRFRYKAAGPWFRGNTHVHTPRSDGGTPLEKIARLYQRAGYHFLFRTDHWVQSDVASESPTEGLLWMDGIELDGRDSCGAFYHVTCLGRTRGLAREMGLESAMRTAREQGALLILAHPYWSGNTLEDAIRWGFDGVEIYNHVCRWLNGKGEGLPYWSAMLAQNTETLAVAADDSHLRPEHPVWKGGWIMVQAPACTSEAILEALRVGRFYASCGPTFKSIELLDNQTIRARTSPIQFARLVGPASLGCRTGSFGRQRVREINFPVPRDWPYCYLEIEDDRGRRAWTNTLFTERS